jgi:copper chaperone CopZ
MCAMKLEGLEDDLPGVKHASASYRQQRLEIEFDETRVSEAQVFAAIRELGYEVQV